MPMIAIGLVIAMGAGAVGIDLVKARALQQSLSLAADAAALAAAPRMPDTNAARQAALAYVEKNMPSAEFGTVLSPSDVEFGDWNAQAKTFTPNATGQAVRITTRLASANGNAMATSLAAVIGINSLDIEASAVAGRTGIPCVLALHPSQSPAMLLDSNAKVEAVDCGVHVNSTAMGALRIDSNATLSAAEICIGGTAQMPGNGSAKPTPNEFCAGFTDPLAGMKPPAVGGCDFDEVEIEDSHTTLKPGVYCEGLEIDGTSKVTLSPGVYVIKDGPLSVLSNSALEGSGVTIYLTGSGSQLFFDSNSKISLEAPTSGPFEGVLIYQDPKYGGLHAWNGNSSATLQGVIYLPSGKLFSENENQITPKKSCTVLIVNEMEFNSNSGISIDLTDTVCRSALPAAYRRGVVLLQ